MIKKSVTKEYKTMIYNLLLITAFIFSLLLFNLFFQKSLTNSNNYIKIIDELIFEVENNNNKKINKKIDVLINGGILEINNHTKKFISLNNYISPDYIDLNIIKSAISQNNVILTKQALNEIHKLVAKKSSQKIQIYQFFQIALALTFILIYVLLIIRSLKYNQEKQLTDDQSSSKQDSVVFNTVSEGILFIDKNHNINLDQSLSVQKIFQLESKAAGNIFYFLSHYMSNNDLKIFKDYIHLITSRRINNKLIDEINPLTCIKINIIKKNGSFKNKYLQFHFKKINNTEKNTIDKIICTVIDITKQVNLEHQLDSTNKDQEVQTELLIGILHIDSNQIKKFFINANNILSQINQKLEDAHGHTYGHGQAEIKNVLREISTDIHQLKADATNLSLHQIEFSAHDFATEIQSIKNKHKHISGKDLLNLITQLRDMFQQLHTMQTLVERFQHCLNGNNSVTQVTDTKAAINPPSTIEKIINNSHAAIKAEQDEQLSVSLQQLVDTIAKRSGKKAKITTENYSVQSIPSYLLSTIVSSTNQMVRNSLMHSIEFPNKRIELGKDAIGHIQVSFNKCQTGYRLEVKDDGKGIDVEKIKKCAQQKHHISAEQAKHMDSKSLLRVIFESNFSTKTKVSIDAGRGQGLSNIKKLVTAKNGKFVVDYKTNQYCHFKIFFPNQAHHSQVINQYRATSQ